MVAITDGMNARDVCFLLAERNHQEQGPNWTVVEKIPDLHLGREHEVYISYLGYYWRMKTWIKLQYHLIMLAVSHLDHETLFIFVIVLLILSNTNNYCYNYKHYRSSLHVIYINCY